MKTCTKCNKDKLVSEFPLNTNKKLAARCKGCRDSYNKQYRERNYEVLRKKAKDKYWEDVESSRRKERARLQRDIRGKLIASAKYRALKFNIPFDITKDDIELVTHCPILGIELKVNEGKLKEDSFTLDKVIPELGYIKGNVIIVSCRANRLKSDASLDEMEKLYKFYKELKDE